jgi:RNA polymerase sigma-70 factor (ECF subfamily)
VADVDPVHKLLERIRAGDEVAVHVFYRRVEPFVRGLARRWLDPGLRRHLDSVDIAQSTFRRILQGSMTARFEDEARALAWVATIVRNRIRTAARHPEDLGGGPLDTLLAEGGPADPKPSPLERAAQAEEVDRFRWAMEALPEDARRAIVLHDFEGLGFTDVARALGRPTADAARKVHDRGVEQLRRELGGR